MSSANEIVNRLKQLLISEKIETKIAIKIQRQTFKSLQLFQKPQTSKKYKDLEICRCILIKILVSQSFLLSKAASNDL